MVLYVLATNQREQVVMVWVQDAVCQHSKDWLCLLLLEVDGGCGAAVVPKPKFGLLVSFDANASCAAR